MDPTRMKAMVFMEPLTGLMEFHTGVRSMATSRCFMICPTDLEREKMSSPALSQTRKVQMIFWGSFLLSPRAHRKDRIDSRIMDADPTMSTMATGSIGRSPELTIDPPRIPS
jgi:hypothetical protein